MLHEVADAGQSLQICHEQLCTDSKVILSISDGPQPTRTVTMGKMISVLKL